tara:strand:+ start:78 stop:542 length:465 start_codon:yes stop_codon:yes gene_type:complete
MKKKEKSKLYMGLFIVFLMISSTIGFMYSSDNSKKYNGHSFTLTDNGWTTFVNKQYWSFDYLPKEVIDVNVNLDRDVLIYVEDNQYFYELSNKFALLGIIVDRADIITCNSEKSVLVFNEMNDNKIYKEDNCFYFEGNINKLIDALFYDLLGIK